MADLTRESMKVLQEKSATPLRPGRMKGALHWWQRRSEDWASRQPRQKECRQGRVRGSSKVFWHIGHLVSLSTEGKGKETKQKKDDGEGVSEHRETKGKFIRDG